MKAKKLILLIFGIGIISSIAIVYFYILQRDFTQNHRNFLISINALENANSDLNHKILQNSIYAYNNQDAISSMIHRIDQEYKNIKASHILTHKDYLETKRDLEALKKDLDKNKKNIDEYLMLNAGVKNSLIFLSKKVGNATFLKKDNKELFLGAIEILKYFNDTKRMQDIDYLDRKTFLLYTDSKEIKIQNFIKNFNLHSEFLMHNYPMFIATTKMILDNKIHIKIEKIKQEFSLIALNDFQALDTFAAILFAVFLTSLFSIIFLFIKYLKENKKLLQTTASLEHSLVYDYLTDLHNRKAFENQLLLTKKPYLLLINIDGFKYINDIYGNDIGNIILRELADILKDDLSHIKNLSIFRLGGDEFGLLFDHISSEEVLKIAQSLEYRISNHHFVIQDLIIHLDVSIASNSTMPILENTDLALKLLKQDPTRRILEYEDRLNLKSNVKENMEILQIIKSAVSEDRIVPFFQPIVNLNTSKIEKYEALVRLKLPDNTFLPPFKFLEISKKSSYYHFITKAMILKTLKMVSEFPQYRFSINISMIDIQDKKLTNILFDALKENITIANRLDIELLESEGLQDMNIVKEFIVKIHKFGSKILIDDFGTGYSNFSYFSELDIDIVKIDGSIVSEVVTNERKLHMLRSIYKFSSGMNMHNVAEFVETREVALLLRDIGVKYGQGYYFSKPLERPLESDEVVI